MEKTEKHYVYDSGASFMWKGYRHQEIKIW